MLIAHTIDKRLTVLTVIHHFQCYIFCHHSCKCLGNFIFITFIIYYIFHICIWFGVFGSSKRNRSILCRERITGSCCTKFCDCSDISGKKLAHFYRFISVQGVDFTKLCFCICLCIIKDIIAFQYARTYFHKRVFSDKRINHSLKYICTLRLCKVIICLKDLICLTVDSCTLTIFRTREETYNIRKEIGYALRLNIGAHRYRNDRTVHNFASHSRTNLFYREFISFEITFHKGFTRLSHCFKKFLTVNLQILL